MTTDRNQLASVGWLSIWSLSDALLEKEVFQSARIHGDGLKLILAEETPSFHSTTARSSHVRVMKVLTTGVVWVAKSSSTSAKHCISWH